MWLPTRVEFNERAMEFAKENAHRHYDRMGYGENIEQRRNKIYIGKICEYTVCQYLEEVLELDVTVDRTEGKPDLFDFKVRCRTGDVKGFHIYLLYSGQMRSREQVERDSYALLPVDQYRQRPKDLYIFAMLLGDSNMPRSLNKTGNCFIKWATYEDISGWRVIEKGSQVFTYPKTRTDNYGEKMSECRRMEDFITWLIN